MENEGDAALNKLVKAIEKKLIVTGKKNTLKKKIYTLVDRIVENFNDEELSFLSIKVGDISFSFKSQLLLEIEKRYLSNHDEETIYELTIEEIEKHRFLFGSSIKPHHIRKILISKIVGVITFESQVRFLSGTSYRENIEPSALVKSADALYSILKAPLRKEIVTETEKIVETISNAYPDVANDVFKDKFIEKAFFSLWTIPQGKDFVDLTRELLETSKWYFEMIEKSKPELKHKYLEHILIRINHWFGLDKHQYCSIQAELATTLILFCTLLFTISLRGISITSY